MKSSMKGISPYVGAVMLVVIAVSVGFFLSGWYSTLVKGKTEEYENQYTKIRQCEKIDFSYYGMEFNVTGDNYFRMYIKNQGRIPFTLSNISVFGHNGNIQEINNTYRVDIGVTKRISFKINSSIIDKIDLITITVKECPENSIEIESYEIVTG